MAKSTKLSRNADVPCPIDGQEIRTQLARALRLDKCRKCGCLDHTLRLLQGELRDDTQGWRGELKDFVLDALGRMKVIEYTCFGCRRCYPALAENRFRTSGPGPSHRHPAPDQGEWPPVPGEYHVLDAEAPVAVTTLGDVGLALRLASEAPKGLAIVGKTETENIGIEKLILNVVSNPALRFLVLAGDDPEGHFPGRTLLTLSEAPSPASYPSLPNLEPGWIEQFLRQVKIINLIGCREAGEVVRQIAALAAGSHCNCGGRALQSNRHDHVIWANREQAVRLDRAGYFVILPIPDQRTIRVEHYDYANRLLRVVEGDSPRSIALTLIEDGWVSELTHAAYLGRELERAWQALTRNQRYVQDRA